MPREVPRILGPARPLDNFGRTYAAHITVPAGGGAAAAAQSNQVSNFTLLIQEKTNWCWAAVSTAIAQKYGSSAWTQCSVVGAELNKACCNTGPGVCNDPWFLDRALSRVAKLARTNGAAAT